MSDPTEEAVESIKAMGLTQDEDQIREVLLRCNNNLQEAVHLLFPESPTSEGHLGLLEGYRDVPPPPLPHYGHEISQDSSRDSYDVDMRDTETHPSPGADSDHDSTTVSYSLEENTIQDLDEDIKEGGRGERGVVDGAEEEDEGVEEEDSEFRRVQPHEQYQVYHQAPPTSSSGRHDGPPPRYEDIVDDNQGDVPSTPPPPLREDKTTPTPGEMGVAGESSSIEFPLTHYYELEGRVHTEQWSIPYKRDESLAICMIAATRMVLEGEGQGLCGWV